MEDEFIVVRVQDKDFIDIPGVGRLPKEWEELYILVTAGRVPKSWWKVFEECNHLPDSKKKEARYMKY